MFLDTAGAVYAATSASYKAVGYISAGGDYCGISANWW